MTKQEAPAPEPMVRKRRIMDFAPISKPATRVARSAEVSKKTEENTKIATGKPVVTKVPTNSAPRKRLFMGDVMRPVHPKRPAASTRPEPESKPRIIVQESPDIDEPEVEEADTTIVINVDEDQQVADEVAPEVEASADVEIEPETESEAEPEQQIVQEDEPVENLVEKPRYKGIAMDFVKKMSSVISSARRGTRSMAEPAEVVDALDAPDITESDDAEEAGNVKGTEESQAEEIKVSRITEEVTTDEGSFTVADALDAMAASEQPEPVADENEDEELAAVLAGFADATSEAPDLSDNLSPEAQDFTEEIDALEESEGVPAELLEVPSEKEQKNKSKKAKEQSEAATEDFISEPQPLFGLSGIDPLVEQSINRKKPEFKEPTTYIDGSTVRGAGEKLAKKPPVEPYRQILGGRSPYLNSVPVEKRPLSSHVPEQIPKTRRVLESEKVEKTSYKEKILKTIHEKTAPEKQTVKPVRPTQQVSLAPAPAPIRKPGSALKKSEIPAPKVQKETISVPEVEGSTSKFPLAIAVALTLVLGAIAGAFVYLVFLQ
ncbi:hypothetical protein IJG79_00165 [Candidatus Saccharibacteria bacterium]|nr:hypothetical protein [Candidatus Saccharibacteria bacterium]